MESYDLIFDTTANSRDVSDQVVTPEQTLAPSIHLEGTPSSIATPMRVLNDEKAVANTTSREKMCECLAVHGIKTTDKSNYLKQYLICIFQTHVLLTYRTRSRKAWLARGQKNASNQVIRVASEEQGREVRRVRTLAIRALYALGLDYGLVRVAVQEGNQLAIMDVNPAPKLNKEMESAYIQAVREYVCQIPHAAVDLKRVTLGADPEFMMRHSNGRLVMASKYFPRRGRVGCDAIWHGQNRMKKPLVELRPEPTTDPRELVIRLYRGMMMATRRVSESNIQWLAGALPHHQFPLGGHIHFSGITLNFKLLRALDHYLALPMVLVEDRRGIGRRPKYGFLGDFRPQFHGGFEYRTLPSWLISPTLSKGVLAAGQLIAARYPELTATDLVDVSVQKAYYEGQKEELQDRAVRLWEELTLLPEYKTYKNYLDSLASYLFSGTTWDESKDFRISWKLPPYRR
ncbi:putative amidoligase domain-containing protein [Marininema halotolerans]|uniref:Phage phiEco32-like COOH.NH2 ligase-type 2 n=1 Tax=Marininema halotolerans TaxID=1155944 RepID=A0A1I6R6Z2_9BACL|nr:hypothetical protein [Marininema halotolerans]SFS60330.1 Phage phiEco32-like COOH.NH2 ligase-type 2 [Marininema halotolerans]